MPQLRLGSTPVSNLKLGTTQVAKAYIGTTLVWAGGQTWAASPATLSYTFRSSTWGPALVPAGRTVHWDASHEASFTYAPGTDLVAMWNDVSGNGWYLREPVPGKQQPSRVIGYNGLPVIEFEAEEWLVHWGPGGEPLDINLPQPITVQIVAACNPYPGNATGFIGGSGFGAGNFQVTVQNPTQILFSAGNFVNYTGTYSPDQMLITAVFNGASSLQRIDGVQIGTGDVGTSGVQRLQIGVTHTLMRTTICEIVFYNRVLTGPEITYNENLLQKKWFKPAGIWTGSAATVSLEAAARTWFTGTAPAFRPDSIETCIGWWDASDASTFSYSSGASVSQWRDKTGAGRHLAAPSSPDEPDRTGSMNGLTTVAFDGAAWMIVSDYVPPAQPYTLFVTASVATGGFYGLVSGPDGTQIKRRGDTNLIEFDAGLGVTCSLDAAPHLFGAVFDRGRSQQRIDGVQISAVDTGPKELGQFRVGNDSLGFSKMVGQVAEIVLYNRHLTSTEITEVEAYLLAKWFGPPPPQTWTGSSATLTVTATSGAWALVAPQTWTRSAATLTITATSGTWSLASGGGITDPEAITGCLGWGQVGLAGHVTLDGSSKVNQFGKPGMAMVLDQASGGDAPAPTGTINGQPAITWDGTDWMVDWSYGSIPQPFTVGVMVQLTATPAGNQSVWSRYDGMLKAQSVGGWTWNSGNPPFNYGTIDTNPHALIGVYDNPGANNSSQWLDGVKVGSQATGPNGATFPSLGDPDGKPFMKVTRWACYGRRLTDTECEQLSTWLVGP